MIILWHKFVGHQKCQKLWHNIYFGNLGVVIIQDQGFTLLLKSACPVGQPKFGACVGCPTAYV